MLEEFRDLAEINIYARHVMVSWERGELTLVEALLMCIKQLAAANKSMFARLLDCDIKRTEYVIVTQEQYDQIAAWEDTHGSF